MSGRYRLQKAHKQAQQAKQDELNLIPGELGLKLGGKKLVEVTDRPGYVYVRLRSNQSEVIRAFNDKVALVYGLPVLVVIDPKLKGRYYIYGRDIGRYVNWGTAAAYLPHHGDTHSYDPIKPGNDLTWIWSQQFMPLAGIPSGTNASPNMLIEPTPWFLNNQWTTIGGTGTPSLLAYNPTGTSAKMLLIYINGSGNPQVVEGNSFAASLTGSASVYPYIPAIPADSEAVVAAVRLVSGTATIGWDNIYDLRQFYGNGGGGSTPVTLDPLRVAVTDGGGTLTTLDTFRIGPLFGTEAGYPSITIGTSQVAIGAEDYLVTLVADATQVPYPLQIQGYTTQPLVDMYRANGDVDAPGQVLADDVLGEFNFYGQSNSSSQWSAQIQAVALQNFTASPFRAGSELFLRVHGTGSSSMIDAVEVMESKTKFIQDAEVAATGAFYLGDPNTDGTWRIVRSGNNLVHQRRESGTYVTKQTISA